MLRGDIGAVAGRVEGAEAGRMLGEFMGPELPVGLTLGNPEPREDQCGRKMMLMDALTCSCTQASHSDRAGRSSC